MHLADNIEWIFAVDEDEPVFDLEGLELLFVQTRHGCVKKVNALAEKAKGDVFFHGTDDVYCPHAWDSMILDAMGDLDRDRVLALSDGRKDDKRVNLIKGNCMTRKRYERYGFFFHPYFFHLYADNFFSDLAWHDNVVIDGRHIVLDHRHPAYGTAKKDAIYDLINAPGRYKQGKIIYQNLIKQFGINPVSIFQNPCGIYVS